MMALVIVAVAALMAPIALFPDWFPWILIGDVVVIFLGTGILVDIVTAKYP